MAVVLSRKSGGGGGSGSGVTSLAKSGDVALTGAVTLSEGSGVTLTQVGQDIEIAAGGGGLFDAYAILSEQQVANTNGGTFTSGAWRTRALNTEVDPSGIVTLAANQLTLQAGSYMISAVAPGYTVQSHKAKLADITNTADAIIGTSEWSWTDVGDGSETAASWSKVIGRVSIAGATVFELQHRCSSTFADLGFGVPSNFGVVEVYSVIEIYREA